MFRDRGFVRCDIAIYVKPPLYVHWTSFQNSPDTTSFLFLMASMLKWYFLVLRIFAGIGYAVWNAQLQHSLQLFS